MLTHNESLEHQIAKLKVLKWARDVGYSSAIETSIRNNEKEVNLRADVLVSAGPSRIIHDCAIEFQRSDISVKEIEERTRQYFRMDLGVMWIPFLDDEKVRELHAKGHIKKVDNGVELTKYPSKPYENWLRQWTRNIWYYAAKRGFFWRATCKPYMLTKTFHPDDIRAKMGETYTQESERWVSLQLEGPYHLDQLDIFFPNNHRVATFRLRSEIR